MNYRKGFFRIWLVVSFVWIGIIALSEFSTEAFRTLSNDRNIDPDQKVARVQIPNGRIARFAVPKDTTPEQAQRLIEGNVEKLITDLPRIKRNVAKMASMNAPEEDIDGYIASEGVTVGMVRDFPMPLTEHQNSKKSVKDFLLLLLGVPLSLFLLGVAVRYIYVGFKQK